MKTIHITAAFTGYPNGKRRDFAEGEEPELANDYADLIIGKQLARDITPAAATEPETHKPAAPAAKKKD